MLGLFFITDRSSVIQVMLFNPNVNECRRKPKTYMICVFYLSKFTLRSSQNRLEERKGSPIL